MRTRRMRTRKTTTKLRRTSRQRARTDGRLDPDSLTDGVFGPAWDCFVRSLVSLTERLVRERGSR
jgi:hypothetical protein